MLSGKDCVCNVAPLRTWFSTTGISDIVYRLDPDGRASLFTPLGYWHATGSGGFGLSSKSPAEFDTSVLQRLHL